jgi:hypothetical protein
MRHGKWRSTATKPICMALRISVGLFSRIFGFGLWLGKPPAAGLAQFHFHSTLGARDGFPDEIAHFFC